MNASFTKTALLIIRANFNLPLSVCSQGVNLFRSQNEVLAGNSDSFCGIKWPNPSASKKTHGCFSCYETKWESLEIHHWRVESSISSRCRGLSSYNSNQRANIIVPQTIIRKKTRWQVKLVKAVKARFRAMISSPSLRKVKHLFKKVSYVVLMASMCIYRYLSDALMTLMRH